MSTIRFLIADASPSLHTFMRQLLIGYGFEAHGIACAADPASALLAAEENRPDFLLTDWFPKETMQGIELFQSIQRLSPQCRFAMLSSDASNAAREKAQEAGAVFLMKKPCTAQELRNALANAMELLSIEHPKMAAHVRAQRPKDAQPVPAPIPIKVPKYEVGEQVLYQGRRASIKYVILRRGELVVQLHGSTGLIPATNIQTAA